MRDIRILQFNCSLANYGATRPILDVALPTKHQVLIIQELGFSRQIGIIYYLKGYVLVYKADPIIKVYFIISREIKSSLQSFQVFSRFVIVLRMQTIGRILTIINNYNLQDNSLQIRTQNTIKLILKSITNQTILLGDFNYHYPSQGGPQAARELQVEHLQVEAQRYRLTLITLLGEPTQRRGAQQSIINLTLILEELEPLIEYCGLQENQATTQDYILINIKLALAALAHVESRQFTLKKVEQGPLCQSVQKCRQQESKDPLTALQKGI